MPLVWHGMKPGRKSLYHQRLSTTIYPAWVKHFLLFLSYFLSNVSFDKFGELKHGVGQTRLFISYQIETSIYIYFFTGAASRRSRHIFLFGWILMPFLFELYSSLTYIFRAVTQQNRQ